MSHKTDSKPSVLLVDDHPANLIALEAVLGTVAYDLITASSGSEALSILERHEVSLVLLDVQMPEVDGYEVLRRIKTSERTQDIPVILITAIYTEDPYVKRGYEFGAIDYFTKPFNPDFCGERLESTRPTTPKTMRSKRARQSGARWSRRFMSCAKRFRINSFVGPKRTCSCPDNSR